MVTVIIARTLRSTAACYPSPSPSSLLLQAFGFARHDYILLIRSQCCPRSSLSIIRLSQTLTCDSPACVATLTLAHTFSRSRSRTQYMYIPSPPVYAPPCPPSMTDSRLRSCTIYSSLYTSRPHYHLPDFMAKIKKGTLPERRSAVQCRCDIVARLAVASRIQRGLDKSKDDK